MTMVEGHTASSAGHINSINAKLAENGIPCLMVSVIRVDNTNVGNRNSIKTRALAKNKEIVLQVALATFYLMQMVRQQMLL